MAEIKIKKKAPMWPWIIGVIIVALLVYFLVFANDNTDDVDDRNVDDTEQVVAPEAVNENTTETINEVDDYNKYVSDQNMDVSHEYSSTALNKLIAATRATADKVGVDINADLTEADKDASAITSDPHSLDHSNKIKEAANKIAKALKTIQTEKFPDLNSQYQDVETAVSNIKSDTPTLDQKDAIKGFFNKAANLLTSIQNNHGH